MKLDGFRSRWKGFSARKKWTIAGVGALFLVAAANGQHGNDRNFRSTTGQADGLGSATSRYSAQGDGGGAPGYNGDPSYSRSGYAAGAGSNQGGAGSSTDTTSGWEANQRSQEQTALAFDQNLRDQSTLRDSATGEVVTGVANPTADAAVGGGAATQVPTSELPTSSE